MFYICIVANFYGSVTNYLVFCSQVVIADASQGSQSRLPTSITNFSLSQKEKTLNELIQDRWLSYTPTGKIGLGIRSFLDLRSWLRSNDIPSCEVCNEACIKVQICHYELRFYICIYLVPMVIYFTNVIPCIFITYI